MRLTRIAGSVLLVFALAAPPVAAADIGAQPQPTTMAQNTFAATDAYLRRKAVLLMIRASFDVISADEIEGLLAGELQRLGASAPGDYDLGRLDRDLMAETSYYLVSLRYLIESGGAVWPDDRPEQTYVNDALVELDALADALEVTMAEHADPLPILERAQKIMFQTEGFATVPSEHDGFAGRDQLVEKVIAEVGPRTRT